MVNNMANIKRLMNTILMILLIGNILSQTQNLHQIQESAQTQYKSVHQNSGAMYSFQQGTGIKIFTRSDPTSFLTNLVDFNSSGLDTVMYGQIIEGNHLALIVKKTASSSIFLQIHKFVSGNPPDKFSGLDIVEHQLGSQNTNFQNFDIDWGTNSSNTKLYLGIVASGVYIFNFNIQGGFLTNFEQFFSNDLLNESQSIVIGKTSLFTQGFYSVYSQIIGGNMNIIASKTKPSSDSDYTAQIVQTAYNPNASKAFIALHPLSSKVSSTQSNFKG